MNKIYTSLILVFALIVMWTVYLTNVKNDDSLTVRYYTIEELLTKEASITKVKVGGLIKPDSISINETDQLEVSFYVYQGSDSLKVYYYGIRPDLFKDDAPIVLPSIKGLDAYIPQEEFFDSKLLERVNKARPILTKNLGTPKKIKNKAARKLPNKFLNRPTNLKIPKKKN